MVQRHGVCNDSDYCGACYATGGRSRIGTVFAMRQEARAAWSTSGHVSQRAMLRVAPFRLHPRLKVPPPPPPPPPILPHSYG
eukprot:2923535-Pyramimonas_sp.AAC.1